MELPAPMAATRSSYAFLALPPWVGSSQESARAGSSSPPPSVTRSSPIQYVPLGSSTHCTATFASTPSSTTWLSPSVNSRSSGSAGGGSDSGGSGLPRLGDRSLMTVKFFSMKRRRLPMRRSHSESGPPFQVYESRDAFCASDSHMYDAIALRRSHQMAATA